MNDLETGVSALRSGWLVGLLALASPAAAAASDVPQPDAPLVSGAALEVAAELDDPALRRLAFDLLERSPQIAAATQRARVAEQAAPIASALPDPTAMVTAFVAPPETRVGPQHASATLLQRLPWRSRRTWKERAAVARAASLAADSEAVALAHLSRLRFAWEELRFLGAQLEILGEKRSHMSRHEEVARARYASGSGTSRDVIKLQAEIARVDQELLQREAQREALEAELAELLGGGRQGSGLSSPLPAALLPDTSRPFAGRRAEGAWDIADLASLVALASSRRPEMAAARSSLVAAEAAVELADLASRPDFTVGLTMTLVGGREDAAGRAAPPRDDGDDVFGLIGGVSIPLWRRPRLAAVESAVAGRRGEELELEVETSAIEREIAEQLSRLPLAQRRVELFADVLLPQAEEALRSAEVGYSAGTAPALDLLDAEHVLFDAYVAFARARADLAIVEARLESAVGAPLSAFPPPALAADRLSESGGSR